MFSRRKMWNWLARARSACRAFSFFLPARAAQFESLRPLPARRRYSEGRIQRQGVCFVRLSLCVNNFLAFAEARALHGRRQRYLQALLLLRILLRVQLRNECLDTKRNIKIKHSRTRLFFLISRTVMNADTHHRTACLNKHPRIVENGRRHLRTEKAEGAKELHRLSNTKKYDLEV